MLNMNKFIKNAYFSAILFYAINYYDMITER